MLLESENPEDETLEEVSEILGIGQSEIESVEEDSTNHLFRIKSGKRRGDFVKIYSDSIHDSVTRKLGISKWPEPSERAEAEVKASKYMEQAGFVTPETERLKEDAVLIGYEPGFQLPLAVLGSTNSDAKEIGRELGNCFANMRKNQWLDYDTNPGNYLIRTTDEGYNIASIDNEMFKENVPEAVIDSRATHIQENVRSSIDGVRDNTPFPYFAEGFSNGYGEELEMRSGLDKLRRDIIDFIRY